MRILVTADLHYDVARSKAPAEALAKEICAAGGDVLLVAGDCVSTNLAMFDRLWECFEGFKGARLLVAGNHELWTAPGCDSMQRYQSELREACRRNNVHYLDDAPYRCGEVAFVGSVGWYDYSFRSQRLEIPIRFYENKVAPGAAAHFDKHRHLLAETADIPSSAREVTARWMDGIRVKLPMTDIEFTRHLADKLKSHLESVHDDVEHVVAAVHHLPFEEFVPQSIIPNWEFANGFMGSPLFGETLLGFSKVRNAYCGHSHQYKRVTKEHIECVNVGSTYREKRYEVLDL